MSLNVLSNRRQEARRTINLEYTSHIIICYANEMDGIWARVMETIPSSDQNY